MKKVIIGISFVAILAVVAILFVNAKNAPQEVKKQTTTEASAGCGACPSATAACAPKAEAKAESAPCCDAMAKK